VKKRPTRKIAVAEEKISVADQNAITAVAVNAAGAIDALAKINNDPKFKSPAIPAELEGFDIDSYRMSPDLIRANLTLASALPKILKKASPATPRAIVYALTTPLADLAAECARSLNDVARILRQRSSPSQRDSLRKLLIKLQINMLEGMQRNLRVMNKPLQRIVKDMSKAAEKKTAGRASGRQKKSRTSHV
jgi:hypothetical protein